MRLINKTKRDTKELRALLYTLAHKAHISTRGIVVKVVEAKVGLRGRAYVRPTGEIIDNFKALIVLGLLKKNTAQDIAWVWVHELAHTTKDNIKFRSFNKREITADKLAQRITRADWLDIHWLPKGQRLLEPGYVYKTRKEALAVGEYVKKTLGVSVVIGWCEKVCWGVLVEKE
jgi:hypothetical protein